MNEELRGGLSLDHFAEVLAHLRHFSSAAPRDVLKQLGLEGPAWNAAQTAWTTAIADEAIREEAAIGQAFAAVFMKTKTRLKESQPPLASIGRLHHAAAIVEAPGAPDLSSAVPPPAPMAPLPAPDPSSTARAPDVPSYMLAPVVEGSREPPRAPHDVDSTSDALPVVRRNPLPFAKEPSPAFVAEINTPRVPPSRPSDRDPRDDTLALPAIPAIVDEPTFPFVEPGAPAPALTLEQYASLCAEIAAGIEPARRVLERYGLKNEEGRKQEDARWALRLHANEDLKAKYKDLLARFRGHLERNRGR